MTATKIQRLRGIADWLSVMGWSNMATNVREAADELERLGKISAAAIALIKSTAYDDASLNSMCDRVSELREIVEANSCPTK